MPRQSKPRLTDRERILSYVVYELTTSALLCHGGSVHDESSWNSGILGKTYVHAAYYRDPRPGDLVIGKTGFLRGPHEYSIGFYVEPLPVNMGGAVIREIGSNRLCDYANEEFVPIVGLSKYQLLEGERYQFYQKVLQAFVKGGEYLYRFGGVDIRDQDATIWVREAFGCSSEPFGIDLKWDKKTTIKTILAAMRAGGYGTRRFERKRVENPS